MAKSQIVPAKVTLLLTGDEAQTLIDIMVRIGGSPSGPRKHADAIANALREIGVNANYDNSLCLGHADGLIFRD